PMRPRRKTASNTDDVLADVVIEDAGGTHNSYDYDRRHDRIRLARTVLKHKSGNLETGKVLNALGTDGEPLRTVVIVSLPTFPGCLVRTRVLGALETASGCCWIVAIPLADDSKQRIHSFDDLSASERQALLRTAGGGSDVGVTSLTPTEARVRLRTATELFWEEKARAESGARHGAAWKITAPAQGPSDRGEGEPHSWAEHMIPSLPARFQRYVEQTLLPEERILFFAERPEFAPSGRIAFFRSQKLRRGLLIITDRQVMTMLDSLPPDSTMVDWGYLAKSTAVERITSAWVERRDSTAEITLSACALGGEERFTLAFPGEQEKALADAADLLRGFVEPGEAAPARTYVDDPGLSEPELPFGELAARYPYLMDVTGGDPVLAAAASRGAEGRGLGPALAVTPIEVRVFTGSRSTRRPVEVRRIPIAGVSSVELLQSLIKCRFDIFVPGDEEVDRVTMRYDYPDSPAFLQAFIAIRHLLGRPLAGPVR
ncbi:MAG TPA: inorganic diphosphatase, partial [Dehalococcoidia bacterium]|nr:inorganic diphosphatase [Dehalococcoidia bacterium]